MVELKLPPWLAEEWDCWRLVAADWVKADGLDNMTFDDVHCACMALDAWEDATPDQE